MQFFHACGRRDTVRDDDVIDVERVVSPPLPCLPQLSLRVAEGRVSVPATPEVGRQGRV